MHRKKKKKETYADAKRRAKKKKKKKKKTELRAGRIFGICDGLCIYFVYEVYGLCIYFGLCGIYDFRPGLSCESRVV